MINHFLLNLLLYGRGDRDRIGVTYKQNFIFNQCLYIFFPRVTGTLKFCIFINLFFGYIKYGLNFGINFGNILVKILHNNFYQ